MKKKFLFFFFAISFSSNCFSQLNCVEPVYINSSLNCGGITDSVCGCNGVSYPNFCEAFYHNGITSWTSGSCNNPPACHADFTYNDLNGTYHFSNNSSAGTNNWFWDFGDGLGFSASPSPTYLFSSSGTYMVCLTTTDNNGCESTTCKVIEAVVPNLNCSALFGYSDSCGFVHFIDFSAGSNLSYDWDFGDATFGSGFNPYHAYTTSGWYNVCLTITDTLNACVSQFCQSCYIHLTTGTASFTYLNPIVFQVAFDASFTGTASNWYWNFGDGNTANIEDTTYTYSGCVYTACLQVADEYGCLVTPVCQLLNACIANPCYVNFTHADSCNIVTFTAQNLTSNNTYNWNFGDGTFSTAANPIHIYSLSGNYNVCLISTDTVLNCSDTACNLVSAHVMIGAPAFTSSTVSYNPNVVEFIASFSDTAGNWIWNFGDGQNLTTTDSTVLHTYANCLYTPCVQVHDSFGCYSPVICDSIIACEPSNSCNADFGFVDSCGTVQLINFSTGINVLTYHWYFGDFNEDSILNPVHQYLVSSNYEICLEVSDSINQCFKTFCDSVPVHVPVLNANFLYLQTSHNPNVVSFFDFTPGTGIENWVWNFNDTTVQISGVQNPVHTFNGCEYMVCLTVTDSFGCSSVHCDSVHLCEDGIEILNDYQSLDVYFNPVINSIEVRVHSLSTENFSVQLSDILGRKIIEVANQQTLNSTSIINIPVNEICEGLYFVTIVNNEFSFSNKVEIKR